MSSSRSSARRPQAPSVFPDSAAHLRAELEWVHQLLRSEVRAAVSGPAGAAVDEFSGLYISREEIERYLGQAPNGKSGRFASGPQALPVDETVARARDLLDERASLSTVMGVDLRLPRLSAAFALGPVERATLLCAVAAELDAQAGRLFAYLQNDATRKRPTFALLARLILRTPDPVATRRAFAPSSPLFACRLLDAVGTDDTALPSREARPAPGIVEFLIGIDGLPPPLAQAAELLADDEPLDDLSYHRHHRTVVEELVRRRRGGAHPRLCYVSGPPGAGKHFIARELARVSGMGLIRLRCGRARSLPGGLGEEAGRLLGREALLRNCLVLLDGIDESTTEAAGERTPSDPLESFLQGLAGVDVIATGTTALAEVRHRLGLRAIGFELPYPTCLEREEIWRRELSPDSATALAAEVPALAQKFRFTPGQIARTARIATASTSRGQDDGPSASSDGLYARCREEAQRGLHRYCQKIVPRFQWSDIVLPADTQAQLQEICRWVTHRTQVHESWGFDGKLAVGKGVTVLFSGGSGTGKTMSAEVIAADLQLDLFRVDLSRIVSKYIGETEKNLSRIFEQSAVSNCVLFFDEADALFGKRTEVKDAHDRYANIEVNYLLSEMDQYEGIIIVSTNIKGNLDPAFIRRFSHVVEYPVPNERLRETIWRKAFPVRTPLAADVDFAFLAQKFNIAGGNIKNIALTSAFLAAAETGPIGMEHLIRATKREYQKIGRACSRSDFGQYYGLVREADVS